MERTDRNPAIALPIAILAGAILAGVALAIAGSDGGSRAGRVPVFAVAIGVAFLINWLAFIPAFLTHSERFFDLIGSVTYLTIVVLALALTRSTDPRSVLLLALVTVWTLRLGTFLVRRVMRSGGDRRFDAMKQSFLPFLQAWTLQGLWVSITVAAALAAVTSGKERTLHLPALVGVLLWAVGFGVEAVADTQKSRFRADPANSGRFISTGLWSWSRHPNYFGEIVLWIGVAVVAFPALRGFQYATLVSPLFVTALLTKGSGIPILERRGDEKWGGEAEYEAYKRRTSLLVPLPPRRDRERSA